MVQTTRPLIVSSGTFDAGQRRFKFRRAPLDLPEVAHGQRLILVDSSGEGVIASTVTGGERAFARYASWVLVDVAGHDLTFEFGEVLSTSHARYIVVVDVHVDVGTGVEVAAQKITSLEQQFAATLSTTVKRSLRGLEIPIDGVADPVAYGRKLGEDRLHERLVGERLPGLPDWLTVTVTDVGVRNDAAAERHAVDARYKRNQKELLAIEAVNKLLEIENQLKRGELMRTSLGEHMTNSVSATLEAIWLDPTPANFQAAVETLKVAEARDAAVFTTIVKQLQDSEIYMDGADFATILREVMAAARRPDVVSAVGEIETADAGTAVGSAAEEDDLSVAERADADFSPPDR